MNTLPDTRSSATLRLAAGELVLDGRFRLVRAIGEGGMGVVWEAVEVPSGEARAIKFLRPESETEAARRRFIREAEVLRGVSHPNLVATHEIAVDDDGTLAIVMELLRGESLAARLARTKSLPLGQTCAILSRVAAAVKAAHASGVIHRDLKPDNVFLCVDAAGRTDVRVLDFGVAKKIEAVPDKLTDTGTLVGTPHYMSPEQAAGERDLDGKTDVWAIGVMAFECLTGQMPIVAQNYGQLLMQLVQNKLRKLGSVRPDLPPDFLAAVDAALAVRASRSDIGTLGAALVMRADPSIDAPPVSGASSEAAAHTMDMSTQAAAKMPVTPRSFAAPASPAPRSKGAVIAALVLVLAAVAAGGVFVRTRHAPETDAGVASATVASSFVATPPASVPATVSAEPPVTAPPVASSVASSSPPRATSTATAKRPAPKPTGRTPQSVPSATGGRLQGGVGADVPF